MSTFHTFVHIKFYLALTVHFPSTNPSKKFHLSFHSLSLRVTSRSASMFIDNLYIIIKIIIYIALNGKIEENFWLATWKLMLLRHVFCVCLALYTTNYTRVVPKVRRHSLCSSYF